MLDVERRPDVDAHRQQLVDVLPALGMARSGDVRVRELVDQDQRGLACQRGVEIELLEVRLARRGERAPRQDLEARQLRSGVGPAVGLDDAGDDVGAGALQGPGREQHRVGLADAGGRAEVDPEPAAAGALLLLPDPLDDRVGIAPKGFVHDRQARGSDGAARPPACNGGIDEVRVPVVLEPFPDGLVREHFRDLGKDLEVALRRHLRHEQEDEERHRLFVGSAEGQRLLQSDHAGDGRLQALEAGVRDRDTVAETGARELLARDQRVGDGRRRDAPAMPPRRPSPPRRTAPACPWRRRRRLTSSTSRTDARRFKGRSRSRKSSTRQRIESSARLSSRTLTRGSPRKPST